MKETTVSLENAGLSLAEWVARARREHTAFVVLDSALPVARLEPTGETTCTCAQLAIALQSINLSSEEARLWANDIKESRAALSAPENKWQ